MIEITIAENIKNAIAKNLYSLKNESIFIDFEDVLPDYLQKYDRYGSKDYFVC